MTLYVMKMDHNAGGAIILNQPVIPGHQNVKLDLGTRFDKPLPTFDFVLDEDSQGAVLDFVRTTFRGLLVSGKFRKAMESAGADNLDYYPVRIINKLTGEMYQDYFIANVLGIVACMNMEDSRFVRSRLNPASVQTMKELHLDPSKLPGFKIFRLAECFNLVLVDESIKKAAENALLRGIAFIPAEGYGE